MIVPGIESGAGALLLAAATGYLLGSIPFGLLVTRTFGLPDPRGIGSGNIGATNVLRTGSKAAGALTLALDALKGGLPVALAGAFLGADAAQVAALAAFLGHLFPVWLGFRGGKGVATFLGVIVALFPALGALTAVIWLAGAALSRMSSVGALAASALAPVLTLGLGRPEVFLLLVILAVVVWFRHRGNISRILSGNEPSIGQSGPQRGEDP